MNLPPEIAAFLAIGIGCLMLVAMIVGGYAGVLISAFIMQHFPNCAFSKWMREEFFQDEYTTFKSEQQDWLSKRMNK